MKKIFQKLIDYIEAEDIKGLLRFCLILLPFVGVIGWGIFFIFSYVTQHKEGLILLGIACCFIVPSVMNKTQKAVPTETPAGNGNIIFFERLLIQALFTIFTTYAGQFHVVPPSKFSDLKDDLPSGLDKGKNVTIYRFKIISDGEAIEPALFHEILMVHLEESLASGELALGKAVVEFRDQLFSKVFIDECLCAGGVWHISLLICDNERIAMYINNKRQNLALRHSPISTQYEDEDF